MGGCVFVYILRLPTRGLCYVPSVAHWGCISFQRSSMGLCIYIHLWLPWGAPQCSGVRPQGGYVILYVYALAHWGAVLCANTRPLGLCSVLALAHGAASCWVPHCWLSFPIVRYEKEVSCDLVINCSHKRRKIAGGVIPSQSPIFPMRPGTVLVTGRGVRE